MYQPKTAIFALLTLLVTGFAAPVQAARPCTYFNGPEEPVNFSPDPATGFIVLTLPVAMGTRIFNVDVKAAILGFLETAADGSPTRALQTQTWDFRGHGLRLEWNGDTRATPTANPAIVEYTLRFDLVGADGRGMLGRRIDSGIAYANGHINLLDFTGTTAQLSGRLCFR